MPDPSVILQQLAQLQPDPSKPPPQHQHQHQHQHQQQPMPFPPQSPGPQHQQGGSPQFQQDMYGEQKRARTKITEDQLKVLRSYFDISNSPSDDQINLMAQQTGLPPKVIKHWFRNTLFKERQKNKDSPYNFNNPPSTMINLEEYEKTGEQKVTSIKPEVEGDSPSIEDKTEENDKIESPELKIESVE